jgi:hypothetical protein
MNGNGTSNATSFTITLPFAAANTVSQIGLLPTIVDNNTTATIPGRIRTAVNSNIAALDKDCSGAVWTAALGKRAFINFTYEIA